MNSMADKDEERPESLNLDKGTINADWTKIGVKLQQEAAKKKKKEKEREGEPPPA